MSLIDPFLDDTLRSLTAPNTDNLSEAEKERHLIYVGALASVIRHYWNGNKKGEDGVYPRNPSNTKWANHCPHLKEDYRGHNIAAFAVDHDGYIIDFDFNHNTLFDSSVEHAEARLVRRVFSLSQVQDSWNVASEDNPADKYSNALSKVTVYTSLESCTQCTGIMMLGRVKDVVYMQSDTGMYKIGMLLHHLTTKKKDGGKPDFIKAPRPLSADQMGAKIVSSLDDAFDNFLSDIKTGLPFFKPTSGRESRSSSITSFLCTEQALMPFHEAAEVFEAMTLAHPFYPFTSEEDRDKKTNRVLSNSEALNEARQFVLYAKQKGQRGTPHR